MGSTFVSLNKLKSDSKKLFANSRPEAIYLQFVPGQVIDVVTSSNHVMYSDRPRNINSILAKPHYGNKFKRTSTLDEEDRYYPMFRGMVDVPVKGDPVLLCTIGSVQYYLGPLNTLNRPDWNIDHLIFPDPSMHDIWQPQSSLYNKKISQRDLYKISKNFQLTKTSRLQKEYKESLDNPRGDKEVKFDIHGDMVFEGRHGNSIRIGSRDLNPYIFLSNGRNFNNSSEGLSDGSIISITSNGTLFQHFGTYFDERKDENVFGFMLADSMTDEPKRTSSQLVSFVNEDRNVSDIIYNYNKNQVLIHSDRITFNSKKDDIFMSSYKNMHIGVGNVFTLSSENETIIESSNIYLGRQAKTKNESDEQAEPLVLGEQLRLILEELVGILEIFKVTGTVGGISGTPAPDVVAQLTTLKNKLASPAFFSEYHFIEDNTQKV